MKVTDVLIIGGVLVGGWILYNTVVKEYVLGKAEEKMRDPAFYREFKEIVKPITNYKPQSNYTYYNRTIY